MNERQTKANRDSGRTLSGDDHELIDKYCDEFEAAIGKGASVTIDVFVSRVPLSLRPTLQRELKLIETIWTRRASQGHTPSPQEKAGTGLSSAAIRSIGRFDLVEKVGSGAFGAIWRAQDTLLDRIVALKISHREIEDAWDAEWFFREARATADLRHPGIVRVYEAGRIDDTAFIVSDFIEGMTLDQWVEEKLPTVEEIVQLVAATVNALHHAHEAGVIHRDLKPSNIMVDSSGQSLLMDFGLARRIDSEVTHTQVGVPLGTPAYASPEQSRGEGLGFTTSYLFGGVVSVEHGL